MLSVVIPVRNTRALAERCLASVHATLTEVGAHEECEAILIDDESDPSQGISHLFEEFRQKATFPTTVLRLARRKYYTYTCSLGLSLAKGDLILFVSHDMVVPPAYVRVLLEVVRKEPQLGTLRGISGHVDSFPQHVLKAPLPCRNYQDVCSFADYVAAYFGTTMVQDRFLIGDSFLVSRRLIETIGVMDQRFVHLFGDLDFGLRAQRAGFKLLCAKGAWLHHEGAGHTKHLAASGADPGKMREEAMTLLGTNYARFREKWGTHLPAQYPGAGSIDFERLRSRAGGDAPEPCVELAEAEASVQ